MKIFQKGFRTPYTDYRCNRTRVIERFIQLWIDVDGFWNPWMWVPLTLLCVVMDFWVQRYIVFIIVKGWCSSFAEALLSFYFNICLSLSLSMAFLPFFSHFILFNQVCSSGGTKGGKQPDLCLRSTHILLYHLKKTSLNRDYVFLYLWCFICSSLWLYLYLPQAFS